MPENTLQALGMNDKQIAAMLALFQLYRTWGPEVAADKPGRDEIERKLQEGGLVDRSERHMLAMAVQYGFVSSMSDLWIGSFNCDSRH